MCYFAFTLLQTIDGIVAKLKNYSEFCRIKDEVLSFQVKKIVEQEKSKSNEEKETASKNEEAENKINQEYGKMVLHLLLSLINSLR